jgi:predicted small lipoprotein YifL
VNANRILTAFLPLFLALTACGRPGPAPEEVTTTVTEGDEEAWSEPGDPPADEEGEEGDGV